MANRTQIVCLSEGKKGGGEGTKRGSIDHVFINRLIRTLAPAWIRPFKGNNLVRCVPCGGRNEVIEKMPGQLRTCLAEGGHATLMVWADLDDNMSDGDRLKEEFWKEAQTAGITREQFENVVFVFAKYRLENWIQYINTGDTDESIPGPRVRSGRAVRGAAKKLAERCKQSQSQPPLPSSLEWSCQNWRQLVNRMTRS